MIEIAEQLGLTAERERLLVGNENELIDWFDGALPRAFHYDTEWHSVVAFPSSYGSTDELNDHHFHYGYFIGAAANIAARDPKWTKAFRSLRRRAGARRRQLGPHEHALPVHAPHGLVRRAFVGQRPRTLRLRQQPRSLVRRHQLLVGDHSVGRCHGRKEIRDLGIYLLVNQISAAEQYWFNIDLENFPKDFKHRAAGMIWGAGAKYDTWFDRDPALIHGINYLPFTGASLYLGRHPKYVQGAFDEIATESRGSMTAWRDYMLMYLALAAPEKARKMFDDDPYFEPEFGNTLAMTYDWIAKLATIGGHVDTSVTADSPLYAVFKGGGTRQYLGYNPNAEKAHRQILRRRRAQAGPARLRLPEAQSLRRQRRLSGSCQPRVTRASPQSRGWREIFHREIGSRARVNFGFERAKKPGVRRTSGSFTER